MVRSAATPQAASSTLHCCPCSPHRRRPCGIYTSGSGVRNIGALSKCRALELANFSHWGQLQSILPLAGSAKLQSIVLSSNRMPLCGAMPVHAALYCIDEARDPEAPSALPRFRLFQS
ncbi:hypothetical protein Q4I32_003399 [Leishmania shawi]|uniref:Uncharacterized protein n=1 Tax=Leishmania shawi TaxID=5680 RepID=A0AAW3BVR8_9TRYP